MKIESFIFLPQTAINPIKVIYDFVDWAKPVKVRLDCSIACLGLTSIFKVIIDVQIQNIRRFVHWIMPHFNGKRLIIKMN